MKDSDQNELCDYAMLDGTEVGDYITSLLCLRDIPESYGVSGKFSEAMDKELYRLLRWYRAQCEIVEKTDPQPDRVYKELVWRDE